MRFVAAPVGDRSRDLPGADLLDEARELSQRFATAGLRRCELRRVPVEALDARAGGRVWLALELLQVTGSFKVRGALLALSRLKAKGVTEVIAASAGNHGAGVAYAAKVLGMRATVVVPSGAPAAKRSRIEAAGATLIVSSAAGYDEAEREAKALADHRGDSRGAGHHPTAFVSPYDDLAVLAGNGSSLGFEIARALGRDPAIVIAPFGGGGLATGLACALPTTRVYGAQSEASPAFALSLERGAAVESLDADGDTLADGLEGGISKPAFDRARSVVRGVVVISEPAIGRAMAALHRSLGLTAEGSAAVALAPLLDHAPNSRDGLPEALRAQRDEDVVVVLTGRNVDDARLSEVLSSHDDPI